MKHGRIYGLTGGIACGKSTVARLLEAMGAVVIDADLISREVVAMGSCGFDQIKAAFGSAILNADQDIDRLKLGQLVFSSKEARLTLEGITHPLIAQRSSELIQEALASGASTIFYEAALLIEAGRADAFRPLVVVHCSRERQIERIMKRDTLDLQSATRRLEAQMPIENKIAFADHLIENDGELASLQARVEALWTELTEND